MIIVFIGKLGSGKTLGAVNLMKRCYNSGYSIYSNIKLQKIPYTDILNIKDFKNIETLKNLFLLDELWLSADSRQSGSIINMLCTTHMLQSRKKNIDTIITSQDFYQLDKRIRFITNWIIEPKIVHSINGKPHLMLLTIHDLDNDTKSRMIIDVSHDLEEYDTNEIVSEMGDDREEYLEDILVLYADWFGMGLTKKALTARLKFHDGLTPSEAGTIADYLSSLGEYDKYDEHIKRLKEDKEDGKKESI